MIYSIPSPLSSLEIRVGLKVPLSDQMVGPSAPHPPRQPMSTLWVPKDSLSHPYHPGNYEGFRSSVPRTRDEDQMHIFHNILPTHTSLVSFGLWQCPYRGRCQVGMLRREWEERKWGQQVISRDLALRRRQTGQELEPSKSCS